MQGKNRITKAAALFKIVAATIYRACWIMVKPLLVKTFRVFVNQKVPDMGVIGGKIPGLFP